MPEFVSKRLLTQLAQNFESSKSREPWRGHRTRHLRGAVVNRLRPLAKRSHGKSGEGGRCHTGLLPPSAPAPGGPTPGDTVEDLDFSDIADAGASLEYSRKDHHHGMMVDPVIAHTALDSGVHGVGISQVASRQDISTHAGLTSTHGTVGNIEDQNNKAAASGYASLNASSKVVQDPANAQTTAAASKIPLAGAGGTISDAWLVIPIKCRAYLASSQLNLVNGAWTQVQIATESYDVGSFFNTGTYRAVPNVAGYYLVTAQVTFLNLVADKRYSAAIYYNGATVTTAHTQTGGTTDYVTVQVSNIFYCNGTTDYIELYARSGSGGNTVDLDGAESSTFMCVHLLR